MTNQTDYRIKTYKGYKTFLDHPEDYLPRFQPVEITGHSFNTNELLVMSVNMASYLRQEQALKVKGEFIGSPKTKLEIAEALGIYYELIIHLRRILWQLGIKAAWKGGVNGGHYISDQWADVFGDLTRSYKMASGFARSARKTYQALYGGGATTEDLNIYLQSRKNMQDFNVDEMLREVKG